MNEMSNNQINEQKASSHPFSAVGVFKGVVRSFNNGRPTVFVQQLNCTYQDVEYIGNTQTYSLKPNDSVLCTFIDNETKELFVIGPFNKRKDVFVTVSKFNGLIDQLETQINAIRAAFVPSLAPIDLEAFKQEQA